jgi:hypothetical protein
MFLTKNIKNIFTSTKLIKPTNKYKYFFGGLAIGLGVAGYLFLTPEQTQMKVAKKKFDKSYSYESKLKILSYLPEPRFPISENISGSNTQETDIKFTIEEWAKILNTGSTQIENNWLLQTINYMREQLLTEIATFPDVKTRIDELQKILPISLELTIKLENEIQNELQIANSISAEILNNTLVYSLIPYSINSKLVELAIMSFPGQQDILIKCLKNNSNLNVLTEKINNDNDNINNVSTALSKLQEYYTKLHPVVQDKILQNVVMSSINKIKQLDNKTYDNLIDTHVIRKFDKNNFSKNYLDEIKIVFSNLPSELQARMFITSLNNYTSELDFFHELMSQSVVFIKLGQIIAEDPFIASDLRAILSDFRDSNKEQNLIEFWNKMPESMRSEIDSVGKCVGVGSVKQVHKLKLKKSDNKYVLCCIRKGVEDDALGTLKALDNVPQIKGLVRRLEKIIMNEITLWFEADAFKTFKKSDLGNCDFVSVPNICHVTNQYLIRDEAVGSTLSKLYNTPGFPQQSMIINVHKAAVQSAFNSGIVVSDIHFGNQIYNKDDDKIIFFDLGQNSVLTNYEADALLWTLVALSDDKRLQRYKSIVLNKLNNILPRKIILSKSNQLSTIYDGCVNISHTKHRIQYFLMETEKANIELPIGFAACAKMIDALLSQESILNIPNVVEDEIKNIFQSKLSYLEMVQIGLKSL